MSEVSRLALGSLFKDAYGFKPRTFQLGTKTL